MSAPFSFAFLHQHTGGRITHHEDAGADKAIVFMIVFIIVFMIVFIMMSTKVVTMTTLFMVMTCAESRPHV